MKKLMFVVVCLVALCFAESADAVTLSSTGTCPGVMSFDITAAAPFSRIMYLRAFGTGSYPLPPWSPCAGLVTGLDATATFVTFEEADAFGECSVSTFVPPAACGSGYVQCIDTLTCTASNVILIT